MVLCDITGSLSDVDIAITSKKTADCQWLIRADRVQYFLDYTDVITLRIFRRPAVVKDEPSEAADMERIVHAHETRAESHSARNKPRADTRAVRDKLGRETEASLTSGAEVGAESASATVAESTDESAMGREPVRDVITTRRGGRRNSSERKGVRIGKWAWRSVSKGVTCAPGETKAADEAHSLQCRHQADCEERIAAPGLASEGEGAHVHMRMEADKQEVPQGLEGHHVECKSISQRSVFEVECESITQRRSHPVFEIECDAPRGTKRKSQQMDDAQQHGRRRLRGPEERVRERVALRNDCKGRRSIERTSIHYKNYRCNVDGCTLVAQGTQLKESDKFGAAGPRCRRHGGFTPCAISGCKNPPQGYAVHNSDMHGPRGLRCKQHGGGQKCFVDGCEKVARKSSRDDDGNITLRCIRHYNEAEQDRLCGGLLVLD